jgi:dynein heavy chain
MRNYEYQVTYRNADHPPPARTVRGANDAGVFGRDPQLSHFLPLEECDDAEYETRTPQEWVALGANAGGAPARSRWYGAEGEEEVSLKPCRVTGYDEDERVFTLVWSHNGKTKKVKRLNLLFDGEDEEQWLLRLRSAEYTRAEAEAAVRLSLFIEGVPDELVTPLDEDLVDRILSLVAAEFPLQHLHVIEAAIAELREMHVLGSKRAIHNYRFKSPEEQSRLHMLSLPPPPPEPQPSLDELLGTIDTPSPNYQVARSYCDENLFQTHALLSATIHSIHARWSQFADHLLCEPKMRGVALPCELHKFTEVQSKVASFVSRRLKEDWSVNIITTIQNELDQHFNFFEENVQRFEASRMFRFCRMVNIMMTSQLRQLIVASIAAYTDLLTQYRVVLDDDFDIDGDGVAELEEDREQRLLWETRAVAIRERREAARLEAEEALKSKQKGQKKPAAAAVEAPAEDAQDGEADKAEETPALDFELFINPIPYSRRVLEMTRVPNGLEPLFVVRLISNGDAVMYSPMLETVETQVKDVFDNFFASTNDIRGIGDQLFPLLGLKPFPLKPLDLDDPVVKDARERVHRILVENMQAPRQLMQMYQTFDYILRTQIDSLIDSFRERSPPPTQDDFDAALERLATDMDRIRHRTLNEVKFELIKVECEGIKNSLLNKARELSLALMELLAQQLNTETVTVIETYKEIHHKIGIEPKDPEQLQELKAYIDGVPTELNVLSGRYQRVADGYALLLRYKFSCDQEEFERQWEAFEWPKKVNQVLEDSEFKYREYRNRFQLDLRADCEKLTEDIAALATHVEELATLEDERRADEYYNKVQDYAKNFDQYQDLIKKYNRREATFGMPVTQWSHLKEIKTNFEPYFTLWEVAAKFSIEHEKWQSRALDTLDPSNVEGCVNDWSRKLAQVGKRLKEEAPATVCGRIRDQLDAFKPHVPLIRAMRSNLQPSDLKRIAKLVNAENVDWANANLTELIKMGLPSKLADIEEIADIAEKTYSLQKQLDTMEDMWRKMSLSFEPHKETESYKLKANEEIQQQLDDHIQKTQVILGSPYVKQAPKLEDASKKWERELRNVQDVLDEWYKCQATWSYLQPVFTSGDIAKALPKETDDFRDVDTSWRQIMQTTVSNHLVMQRCQEEKLLSTFVEHNRTLDEILKKLHQFLETKRMAFPRFYFISNDELLRILSDSKDPFRVQPYLAKCFEGIKSINFAEMLNITAMESAEGEVVKFSKIVNPADHNNAVELWLAAVEASMCDAIRTHVKRAKDDYPNGKRTDFIRKWPGQVVLAVTSLYWTTEATEAMSVNGYIGLEQYHQQCKTQLEDLVVLVRDNTLKVVERCTLEALVVMEVHAKDVILELAQKKIDNPLSFDWLAQLRYYWEDGNLHVRATNASLLYGYEYLGNTGRLVITQLTDRCYRTLMGALHLNYGGAPEGPAGTGKTETTKDLAKALAKQCVVYNCSDQITYKDMAKLFKGLAQAGAWGCFDEFNRIEVQVLSVIAQQVATIQEAIAMHRTDFLFDGVMIKLKQGSAVFITMNPGYAGRAELPDNLKALFRPVAMMVPNYAMIGEIQLYSYGFIHGKVLAEKIVATYGLCSEQLSSQDHYDYGMRAVKSVLTAAGRLKRKYPDENEHILMLRSIQDVNLPKFLSQDVELFKGIISDLFPGVVLPAPDYDAMTAALREVAVDDKLQLTDYFRLKCFETYEMIVVRHGMMVVGFSYGGKTRILHSLAKALTLMNRDGLEERTRLTTLNPKAVTLNQLYGVVDVSGEWSDGVLSNAFRTNATDTAPDRKWLILDGPVDAVWIENMNTVLDDNKKLCLTNGDIIPMSKSMNMIFEVQDLQHASPATVSRCGMVYVEPDALGWRALVDSYRLTLPAALLEVEQAVTVFDSLIDWIVEPMLTWVRRYGSTAIPQGNSVAVAALLRLFDTFLAQFRPEEGARAPMWEERELVMHIEGWFLFSVAWGLGGCLYNKDRITFNNTLIDLINAGAPDKSHKLSIPLLEKGKRTIFDSKFVMNNGEGAFVDWLDTMPEFTIHETAQYHEIIVPTADTERYSFLLKNFIVHSLPCLLVGDTGTGKTVMIKSMLNEKIDRERFVVNMIQFSAQTSAGQTQELIEAKADVRRRKGVYGPPVNKKLIIFVDDLNMPQMEEYGAQPAIELIRQWLDHTGWYNHKKEDVSLRRTEDLLFLAAMGPPGGGRNHITPRLTRHFNSIAVPSFDDQTLKKIFCTLMDWIIGRGYPAVLRTASHSLVAATTEVYETLIDKLKPTPEKSHYTFNLRDVSKVFQGIYMASAPKITDTTKLYRLWTHEVFRAFADRFINDEDTKWFIGVLDKVMQKEFKMGYNNVVNNEVLYSDFLNDNRNYEEIDDMVDARKALEQQVDAYNDTVRSGRLDLVIFKYVIEHVSRIGRILRQPFGHALLVGVGGSGRTSCTKLACKIQEYAFFSVQVTKGFGHFDFLEAVKKMLLGCAKPEGIPTTFFVTDTHIVHESFLEDICNLLNTGEIPGLLPPDELDAAAGELRNVAKAMGRELSRESLVSLWVERCRTSLHVVLAFSPIGSVLRERLRKFPSLVNCTTIDWFRDWPEEGLRNVAARFLNEIDLKDDMRSAISECFVAFQNDVKDLSRKYLDEARQRTYVTPTSYIELLNTFQILLDKKRTELTNARNRYEGGLDQLSRTAEEVDRMKQKLDIMKPQLKRKAKETEDLIEIISRESEEAEKVRAKVAVEEASANETAKKANAIREECQARVAEAQPKLDEAKEAASSLDVNALREVKSLSNPPELVRFVIEACCNLLGGVYKPAGKRNPQTGKVEFPYWEHAKQHLMTNNFKDILLSFDVDSASEAQIAEVKKNYISKKEFSPVTIEKTSKALVGIVKFVIASEQYYQLNKIVKPLLADKAVAEKEYDVAMAALKTKMDELAKVDRELAEKQANLDRVKREKQELEDNVAETDAQLRRANQLMGSLGGEKVRYGEESKRLAGEFGNVLGDVVMSSATVAYLAPFQNKYRAEILPKWLDMCRERNIPGSNPFSFEKFMGNPLLILDWKLQGLPSDSFSIDNAIIMSNARRYPLFVDPQQQANKWIRNMEMAKGKENLVVVRPSESDYTKNICNAVRQGKAVLLENVDEDLDAVLENLLLKRLVREGTTVTVTIGDAVEWNDNFRLYITTKLPRPHYRPEVSTKVTLCNFMITPGGLQDQLLGKVVSFERPDVEAKKQKMTIEMAQVRTSLKQTEDEILSLLGSDTNLLADESAIQQLDRARIQSQNAASRSQEIAIAEKNSEKIRSAFRPVAQLGSSLFFCVTELANIDPMYQYSLQFYIAQFHNALRDSEKGEGQARIDAITTTFQRSLYTKVCRGLFAKDQLLFSFIMCLKMFDCNALEVRWLLLGGFEVDKGLSPNPFDWLPDINWKMLWRATTQLPAFVKLEGIIKQHPEETKALYLSPNPLECKLPGELEALTGIHRLVVLRALRSDKMVMAVQAYVQKALGDFYIEPPLFNLDDVATELSEDPSVPIIFVLSPGADPNTELDRVANIYFKGNGAKRMTKLSLGQGQDVPAKAMIDEGKKIGNWVLLQNCHLFKDFMPALARIIEDYSRDDVKNNLHRDFRLWLTSMPSENFPVSVLQNGAKLVQEPPKGLRSNLLRSYMSDPINDEAFFGKSNKPEAFRKLLFGLCFFHSLVQERRKFGPLGFNIPYEFNDTDMRISVRQLMMFVNENTEVPYEAITYLAGQCNYGGRVTDDWDRRCLMAMLAVFYTPTILEDGYKFSPSGEYYAPPFGDHSSYVEYIRALPLIQTPEVFGLHLNADITKDEREAKQLMDAVLATQPRESSGSSGADPKTIVLNMAADIYARMPQPYNTEDVMAKYPITYENSMNTVLLQELIRYNRLIVIVRKAMSEVQKAIKGEVVMSAELETVYNAMYDGRIPPSWKKRSYPSLKPFGAYINDLLERLAFLQRWLDKGPPPVFWISGFFFTQSFLTGVKQNFARKSRIEIDKLRWEFTVMSKPTYDQPPADGCYVSGLFLEGAGWDADRRLLCESRPKELFVPFPILQLMPAREEDIPETRHYACPTYKTTDRRGVLSTTGHSTNFIMVMNLPRDPAHDEAHWVKRGAALFTQLEY